MSISATSISSIGQVCQTLQASYSAVRRAIEALGLQPALVINGVPHFADEDVDLIAKHLRGQK
jgi:hypothetical protein